MDGHRKHGRSDGRTHGNLKFCCFLLLFFALKGELNRKILLLRFLFCLAYIYIPQSLSYSTVTLKTGNINKGGFLV